MGIVDKHHKFFFFFVNSNWMWNIENEMFEFVFILCGCTPLSSPPTKEKKKKEKKLEDGTMVWQAKPLQCWHPM